MDIKQNIKTFAAVMGLLIPVMGYAQMNTGKIEPPDDIEQLLSEDNGTSAKSQNSSSGSATRRGTYMDRERRNVGRSTVNQYKGGNANDRASSSAVSSNGSTMSSIGGKNNFVVPTEFNTVLDSLTYSYYARHAHYRNCYKDVNVQYTDKEYRDRLNKLPNEVEMPYNSTVKAAIDLYTERRRKLVENMLGIGKYYFPMIDDILEKYGVPLEFRYLAIIESALNPKAVSRAGAAGMWQFMPSTGRMYGLEINSLVDERRDPYKSTVAAARYIKELYRIYGDWHLAIAAYNCGPGTINRAIRRTGGKRNYWQIYNNLPAETRSYVPIFIAANYVMNYYRQHNLCPAEVDLPVHTDTIEIKPRVPFRRISDVIGIPIDELEILNPQYRRDIVPGGGYVLRLPGHYMSLFIQREDSIYASESASMSSGEEETSAEETSMTSSGKSNYYTRQQTRRSSQLARRTRYHKVRRGENLSGIAKRYGVTTQQLRNWNHLRGSRINAGQRLVIKK